MNFKSYRLLNAKSQSEAAKAIGVNRKTYAKRERRPETFTIGDAMNLSRFYKVSVGDLIGEE